MQCVTALPIREVDGSDVMERVRERCPAPPSSFLDVVARWTVLGKSFTGFIDIATEADLGSGSFGLDEAEFVAIASNGSGDPIGVVPEGATSESVGSIAHFNHDTRGFAARRVVNQSRCHEPGLPRVGACTWGSTRPSDTDIVPGHTLQNGRKVSYC